MTLKQFKIVKIAVAAGLAATFSQAVVRNHFTIAMIAVVASFSILLFLRGKVKEIIADERDYEIGGRAARFAIQAYSLIAVIGMVFFMSQKGVNPAFEPIAVTLAYSTCFLMFLYVLIFRYYSHVKFFNRKWAYVALGIALFLAVLVFGLRLLSGEDDWICQNGQWVMHGHPDFPAPTVQCK